MRSNGFENQTCTSNNKMSQYYKMFRITCKVKISLTFDVSDDKACAYIHRDKIKPDNETKA